MDRADWIAEQAAALWAQLPADEVADDEPLHFWLDVRGDALVVHVDRTGCQYRMLNGQAVKARPVGDDVIEVSTWENGKMVAFTMLKRNRRTGTLQQI